jgi:heme/copper-type cytochrome/quinol oxidase subunit 3
MSVASLPEKIHNTQMSNQISGSITFISAGVVLFQTTIQSFFTNGNFSNSRLQAFAVFNFIQVLLSTVIGFINL